MQGARAGERPRVARSSSVVRLPVAHGATDMRKTLLVACLLCGSVAFLGLLLLGLGPTVSVLPPDDPRGRLPEHDARPEPAGVLVTADSKRVEVSAEEAWVPDGRLWVRVRNSREENIEHAVLGWGGASDRRVQATTAQSEAGGWCCIALPSELPASPALFVGAAGCVAVAMTDLSVERRHSLSLEAAQRVSALVCDLDSGAAIGGAAVSLSQDQCAAPEER